MLRRRERVLAVWMTFLMCGAWGAFVAPAAGKTAGAEEGDGPPPAVYDSYERTVEVAELDGRRGNAEEAIAAYADVLVNASDQPMRGATLNGLLAVAVATEDSSRAADRYGEGCGVEMVVHSAYGLILSAEDRSLYLGNSFYLDAAASDAQFVECAGQSGVPSMSDTEKVEYLLNAATYYPDDAGALIELGGQLPEYLSGILDDASTLHEFSDVRQAVLETFAVQSDAIEQATGETLMAILRSKHCEVYDPEWSTSGLATVRKLIVCPSVDDMASLSGSDVEATSLEEARYTLTYAYSGGGDAECKLWDSTTNEPVYFLKGANFAHVFSLVDLSTGAVAATKVFGSTAMKCCTSGTYDPATFDGRHHSVGECVGGNEPESTYSESELEAWLESQTD